MTTQPFWETKALSEMTIEEWESLCDRCGRCCLHKLEDEDTDEVYYTSVACRLLDTDSCQCQDYPNRKQIIPDCTVLTLEDIKNFHWLPESCAYRRISEKKPLSDWHPLISGTFESVHTAGISVKGWVHSESDVNVDDLEDFIIPHVMVR
ncbi:YcgN family cysteine cluster protein [Endozoicomonas sp.]|uniref:YcgN family cysteine cluster protein n=1 Tax=Endozoicomonas sp. TaxID=1892382 RepID=UPI00288796A7|nr:YcgN family cysteine cluster protein [Endozoicomonas sp.]